MEVTLFTPLLAFAAGLLSCVSPCVLPLLPAYIGNLSGVVAGSAEAGRSRAQVMAHALTFVLGFTLVFVVLRASWAGLAVPFLAAGFAVDRVQSLSLRLRPVMPFVSIISGVILIFAGSLIYTNALAQFNRYFQVSGLGANI